MQFEYPLSAITGNLITFHQACLHRNKTAAKWITLNKLEVEVLLTLSIQNHELDSEEFMSLA